MKHNYVWVLLVLIALLMTTAYSQEDQLLRYDRPVSLKLGLEGIGIDLALGDWLALDATSWIFYNATKARVFLFEKDASPFLGVGYGFSGTPAGSSSSWTVVHGGWEYSHKSILIQILVQYPIVREGRSPFPVNVNIGLRL
jgi:hypothetical protein